jgi:alginate O-acetyltransferase complex protein AlgI
VLFNSVTFAIFFPLVLALYWALRTPRRQNPLLVVASMVFYGWWDWRFLLLLVASTLTDYFCALGIERSRTAGTRGKPWLAASLVINLGILGLFKYYDFFVSSAEPIWRGLGWRPDLLHIVLPVGISFYTFQTMSYTVDVYRGQFAARRSLVDVAAYVMFFPQLVAGPIERAASLLPQMERPRQLTARGIQMGLMLMLTGYLKKVVLADGSAPIAEWFYGRAARGEPIHPWGFIVGAAAFGWQIYGDFSGYSDIARGAARLMGFDLVINFRQPYHARTFGELFQRWHISLASWLRDYLFNTLGGARGGLRRSARNLVITMFLAGLWHGANWTFVSWGLLVGVYLALNQLVRPRPRRWSLAMKIAGLVIVQIQWLTTGPLFRAHDIATAWRVYKCALFGDWSIAPPAWTIVGALAGMFLCHAIDLSHAFHPREELPNATRRGWAMLTGALAAAGFWLVQPQGAQPFIYFQF